MWGPDHGITQRSLHLSLINIYTRSAVMNANLFASGFLLTSPWAEVSWEKLCRLTGSEDISIGQLRGIWISWGTVLFAETEESFLFLETQPKRVFRQLVPCPRWDLMCRACKQFCLQKTAFLYSNLSKFLELNRVRLADLGVWQTFKMVLYSMSHSKDYLFTKAKSQPSPTEKNVRNKGSEHAPSSVL